MPPFLFAEFPSFWFQLLRVLGHIAYGAADFGEAYSTALRIKSGDYDSWFDEWNTTATCVEGSARESRRAGHLVSAHDGLLRAATYYRSAEFYTRSNRPDERGEGAYHSATGCFRDALALTSGVEVVAIPFEGLSLVGYLYTQPGLGPHPTFVMHHGFDGAAEELHTKEALAAQQRGYVVLTFDGPGMPGPRYRDGLTFRPNWESVVSPVIDWLLTRPDVDPERIALFGNSMGGLLAPRAAAYDDRISALVCVDGVYDVGRAFADLCLPGIDTTTRPIEAADADEIDAVIASTVATNSFARWAVRQGMWSFGVATPREFLALAQQYHLGDGIAERIRCPTFVGLAESDEFFLGQPEQLAAHVSGPVNLVEFANVDGAGAHCQIGAQRQLNAELFDWLDNIFDRH